MTLIKNTETIFPRQVIRVPPEGGEPWIEVDGTCGGRLVSCDNPECWAFELGVEIADNGFLVHCGACGLQIPTE